MPFAVPPTNTQCAPPKEVVLHCPPASLKKQEKSGRSRFVSGPQHQGRRHAITPSRGAGRCAFCANGNCSFARAFYRHPYGPPPRITVT